MQGKKGGQSGPRPGQRPGVRGQDQISLDPFGHGLGILLALGFYSKSNEKTLESFKRESGMIDLHFLKSLWLLWGNGLEGEGWRQGVQSKTAGHGILINLKGIFYFIIYTQFTAQNTSTHLDVFFPMIIFG